jgi:hypothetical protein
MFHPRAPDDGCRLVDRDRMLATHFRRAQRRFSSSLVSSSDFGTTPHVLRVHFFLDFIFH